MFKAGKADGSNCVWRLESVPRRMKIASHFASTGRHGACEGRGRAKKRLKSSHDRYEFLPGERSKENSLSVRVELLDWVMIRLRPFASSERYFGTRLRFVSFAACFGPRRTQTNDRSRSFGVGRGYIPNSTYHRWSPKKLFFNI
jgi:hypothetical protein